MKYLQSKSFITTQQLARYFLALELNTRMDTISDLAENFAVARGTIQNALQVLKESKAIALKSRGTLGTVLFAKDIEQLLQYADIHFLMGTMPLPYSKRYEGLSTGILTNMFQKLDLPLSMAYMRGAKRRIDMVLRGRYDFAIVSKYAAQLYLAEHPNSIKIVTSFGAHSFLLGHGLILNDPSKAGIENGMRIGIDQDSIDQAQLTMKVTQGKNVHLIPLTYSQFLKSLAANEIDAVIWNIDELEKTALPYKIIKMDYDNEDNTTAVMVVNASQPEIKALLEAIISVEQVLKIQQEVISGQLIPNY